jgi:predicted FMN-binding regulatory protein PaiB
MAVDPATVMLIASAVKGAGDYLSGSRSEKMSKRKSQETKRQTQADLFQEALNRSTELEASRLQGRNKLGKRRAQSAQDTASLLRGALNI